MLVFASTVGSYVPGNYNNNAALAQVKITADSISNFVRDSSGNISSDFQTALSKTSIITGSTLATSIQKQTATQITSALTDNNGKIISLINQDASGVQISGKNITLDGNTTVTGAFKVSQANIANGAIGTAQIGDAAITSAKIATIDAGKITTGTLTGVNVTVDKSLTMGTSGVMTWALSGSWRDYSFDPYYVYYRQDGNPNQYYVNTVQTGSLNISASNTGGSLTFNGSITAPNAASDTKSYYMYYPSDISTGTNTLYTRVNMGIGGVNVLRSQ